MFHRLAIAHGRSVITTSRGAPDASTQDTETNYRLFDLARPDTWNNIPVDADLLWCFPAAPLEQVQRFASTLTAAPRTLVVLGSTSAYDTAHRPTDYPPPWIDESAAVDLAKPRVQGEEFLRRHHRAILLRVAGIYGPGRSPLDWIRTGRVTASRKYVNLIHVDDLATACLAALERGIPGETYNVSDGTPRTWAEISLMASRRWNIHAAPGRDDSATGKRISNKKLLALFETSGNRLRHPDLTRALQQLQNEPPSPATGP